MDSRLHSFLLVSILLKIFLEMDPVPGVVDERSIEAWDLVGSLAYNLGYLIRAFPS